MSSGSRSSCDSGVGSGREDANDEANNRLLPSSSRLPNATSNCAQGRAPDTNGARSTSPANPSPVGASPSAAAALRVTLTLHRTAVARLRALAHANPRTLAALGIAALNVHGDRVSITLAPPPIPPATPSTSAAAASLAQAAAFAAAAGPSPARNATGGLDSGSSAASAPLVGAQANSEIDSGIDSAPSINGSASHATPPQPSDSLPHPSSTLPERENAPWIEGVKRSVLGYLQTQEQQQLSSSTSLPANSNNAPTSFTAPDAASTSRVTVSTASSALPSSMMQTSGPVPINSTQHVSHQHLPSSVQQHPYPSQQHQLPNQPPPTSYVMSHGSQQPGQGPAAPPGYQSVSHSQSVKQMPTTPPVSQPRYHPAAGPPQATPSSMHQPYPHPHQPPASSAQSENPMTSMEQMLAQRTIVSSSPLLVNLLRSNSPSSSHYSQAIQQQQLQTSESYYPHPHHQQQPPLMSQSATVEYEQQQPQQQPVHPSQHPAYHQQQQTPQPQMAYGEPHPHQRPPQQYYQQPQPLPQQPNAATYHSQPYGAPGPMPYPQQHPLHQALLEDEEPAAKRRKKRKKPTKAEIAAAAAAAAPHHLHPHHHAAMVPPPQPGYGYPPRAPPQAAFSVYPNGQPAWGYPSPSHQQGYPQHHGYPNAMQAGNPHGYPQQHPHQMIEPGMGMPQHGSWHHQQPPSSYPSAAPSHYPHPAEQRPAHGYPNSQYPAPATSMPGPSTSNSNHVHYQHQQHHGGNASLSMGGGSRDTIDTSIDEVVRKTRTDEFDTNFHNSTTVAELADVGLGGDPSSDDSASRDASSTGSALAWPLPNENGVDHHHYLHQQNQQPSHQAPHHNSQPPRKEEQRKGEGGMMGWAPSGGRPQGDGGDLYGGGTRTSHGIQSGLTMPAGGINGAHQYGSGPTNGAGLGPPPSQASVAYHQAQVMCNAQPSEQSVALPSAPASSPTFPSGPESGSGRGRRAVERRAPASPDVGNSSPSSPRSRAPRRRRRPSPAAQSPPAGDLAVAVLARPPLSPSRLENMKRVAALGVLRPDIKQSTRTLSDLELENNAPSSPLSATCRLEPTHPITPPPPPAHPPPSAPLHIEVSDSGAWSSSTAPSSTTSSASPALESEGGAPRRSRRRAAVVSAALLRHSLGLLETPPRRGRPRPSPRHANPAPDDQHPHPPLSAPSPGNSGEELPPTAQSEASSAAKPTVLVVTLKNWRKQL